jgi:voltage-gated sodium channel
MPALCHRIVHAAWFQRAVITAIILAGVLIGLETSQTLMASHGALLHALDKIILAIFILEIVLKMGAHWPKPWRFFSEGWNIFDFIIVAGCLVPAAGPSVAVLRLFRLLRVLRLITVVPRLQLLVGAMLRALPSMGYVAALLGLLFYVYAVMGVMFFGGNDPVRFGDLGRAMLTLFGVVTLEGWIDVMDIQRLGADQTAAWEELQALGSVPAAYPLFSIFYFVSFILIGTMVMLNLVVGVVVNSMDEAHKELLDRAIENQTGLSTKVSVANELNARLGEMREKVEEIESLMRRLKKE